MERINMATEEPLDYDDLGEALREGRALRRARAYRILFAQGDLAFRTMNVADPAPLGRQILAAGGLNPEDGFSLFGILRSGDFEDVRLDEPFDLRERGAERFVAFQTDRNFKLMLNGNEVTWGKPAISGTALYALANVSEDDALFMKLDGGENRLIESGELIDLTAPGIERFVTAPRPGRTFEIIVNARPHTVTGREVSFEQIVQLAFPGPPGPNIVFSMTYRHAVSRPHAGELGPGGVVEVKNGTVFNVTRTDKS
jgi:hypothetical protein